jgi:predicted Zn finger-like uncharacterized protein
MSLITRCPACGTMFKVVSDQLKVSQGWVRCGQCADVFDASMHLQTEKPLQTDQAASILDPLPAPAPAPAPEPEPMAIAAAPAADLAASADAKPTNAGPNTANADDFSYAQEVAAALKSADSPVAATPLADAPDEVSADVSFVRDARRQAFWRKPLVRALLVLVALLMMVLLALQMAVQQRDKLAVFEPRLKPALQMICEVLACNVGPVRQIEAIVIDSSSFNKVNDSVYALSFAIKNTAATAVAMPSLEVTLTDTQDQAVIRRVLTPAQFGMASGLLGASAEFSGALTLQLTPLETPRDAGNVSRRVAGYRLLAFYP